MRVGRLIATVGGAVLLATALGGVLAVVFTPAGRCMARWVTGAEWSALDAAARSITVGQFRLATVQVAAATGASIALLYTIGTYRLSRRGQVTDRFTKALERLSSPEPYVRIGGLLALEQILEDDPNHADHSIQVLNAFIRRHAQASRKPGSLESVDLPDEPSAEVQQALNGLIGARARRRSASPVSVDLSGLHLAGVRFVDANLSGANLQNSNLVKADFSGARMKDVDLTGADLSEATFSRARGLALEQIQSARQLVNCTLPSEISTVPEIAQRVRDRP